MDTDAAHAFKRVIRQVAGLSLKDTRGETLMSSLFSELCFNDLRDCSRRHQKKERTVPVNLHSAAIRSLMKKSGGCKTLDLEPSDWSSPLPHAGAAVKASVHSATRASDSSLGLNCVGLTKNKTNKQLTKPHVLMSRFQLFKLMARVWKSTPGDSEAKSDAVRDAIKKLWLCRLLQPHVFVQIQGHELEANERWLVLSSGPNCLKVVKVKSSPQEEEIYHLTEKSYETGCKSFLVPSMDSVQADSQFLFFLNLLYVRHGMPAKH